MALQLDQIVEGVGAAQLAGMDQAHEQIYAMIGDYARARDYLEEVGTKGGDHGAKYVAAKSFVDGLESLGKRDFATAADQLTESMRVYPNAETAFFDGTAAMHAERWDEAIGAFSWVLGNKALVTSESIGTLIAWSEYNLSVCYDHKGVQSESRKHLAKAQALWSAADAEVKRILEQE